MNAEIKQTERPRLEEALAKAPAAIGPEYAEWLTAWCRSGACEEVPVRIRFKPRNERTPSDYLDEDNLQPMRKMLSHHPGGPMAFAQICRQPSGFLRLRSLVEYLKGQSDEPTVTNASDQGSVTAYVSPLHVNEVMRGFSIDDSDEAEQEIARLRGIARAQVMRDLLGIAGTASEQAFNAATGTWLRKEYARRQASEKPARNSASTAAAGASSNGSGREQGGDQAIALPAERPGRLGFGAPAPAARARIEAKPSQATPPEKPFGFGFRRPAG